MAADPAELAFGHALAMLGDPDVAAEVAETALRRAGRARGSVLAHARFQAVARAAEEEPVDIDNLQTVVLDLPALAATLASTRPPEERAALDLRTRTAGDLAGLGEALGMRPTAAADKCNEIAEQWERTLDSALLAFSGAGECEELARILADAGSETVADLLAVAPAVYAHAQDDTACGDRLRAMSPVRAFFSGGAVDVPDAVRDVGHTSRRRRPAAPPPPLFSTDVAPRRAPRLLLAVGVAAVVVAVVATAVVVIVHRHESNPVNALTKIPTKLALALGEPEINGTMARFHLRNPSDAPVSYRAATSAEWAAVTPRTGRIPAHDAALLTVRALDTAPEGAVDATLTVTTSRGGAMSRDIPWTIEHAPDLDATAQGCEVDVHVVDEGQITSVVLHWRDTTEHQVDVASSADGYKAQLAPEGQPITYWVTAVDDRGNEAQTPDQTIPPGAC
ncbi:MAG TPA: hypothetical protein VHD87_06580 [Acidimicrobiales bacterium]|nr:hypothetical protein [Acidimicrobiales bacterium]